MNKYLLLRDNKQSGPYTVQELIAKGIKAYDLVWLEGKSAAWRYPSEVEELKAFAPVVEEQPFDRFYKKPEYVPVSAQQSAVPETHRRFEPKADVELTSENDNSSKKVYINFPGSAPAYQPRTVLQEKKTEVPVSHEATRQIVPAYSESMPENYPLKKYPDSRHAAAYPNSDRKLLFGAFAVCLLLIIFTVILLINYTEQQQDLKELNTIVQQLENKEKANEASLPASIVQDEPPSMIPSEPQNVTEDPNTAAEKSYASQKLPVQKKNGSDNSSPTEILFKETEPVKEPVPPDNGNDEKKSVPHENLFKLVSVKPNDYKTGLLGGISNLKFELTNNSLIELHKVAVEIKYLGPENKVVKRQMVYFENVSPGAQAIIDVPKSNRGVSIEYTITDIKS